MKMTFETALVHLKQGKRIRRASWEKCPDLYVVIEEDWDGRDCILSYDNTDTPYSAKATLYNEDLLAEDWEVVE
jgi:hypothetical protein